MKTVSGIVGPTGAELVGSGFNATLVGTGLYTIDFPVGTFATLPVVAVSPYNSGTTFVLAKVDSVQDISGLKRVTVSVSSTLGTASPTNGGFTFIAVQS